MFVQILEITMHWTDKKTEDAQVVMASPEG